MQVYIALLRGINVSGQKKIKMAALKILFEEIGFTEVQTYIQSGNLVFKAKSGDTKEFAKAIQEKILESYKFEVPVLVLEKAFLEHILKKCPFKNTILEASYFTLLHRPPEQEILNTATAIKLKDEQFKITAGCVYVFPLKGYGRAKGNNNFFEKKLKVTATTRNYKTMMKLVEMIN